MKDETPTQPPDSEAATRTVPPGAAAEAADLPPADAVPADLRDHPRYRVLGLIGQGGMGAVGQMG